ncbi:MAG: hypothetical protein K2F79_00945 [Muribaculaceae bacterium]|nr:hypothetical protein [Muribaculaceae bacterium]
MRSKIKTYILMAVVVVCVAFTAYRIYEISVDGPVWKAAGAAIMTFCAWVAYRDSRKCRH